MHDQAPNPYPSHKGKIVGSTGRDQTVDRIIEHSDGTFKISSSYFLRTMQLTRNPNNDQRLRSKEGKHNRSEDWGQEHLVNAEALIRLRKHIEREGQRWKNAAVDQ